MVATTSDTFDQLFAGFQKTYQNFAPAEALLWWWNSSNFGIRVEAASLMLEFTNGMYLGKDPEGFLFFHDIRDFKGTVHYDLYYSTTGDKNQKCFVIKFWKQTPDRSFAQFIAKDPNGTITYTNSATGTWQALSAASAAAHIEKDSTDGTWTMTIPSINKSCTWTDNSTATSSIYEAIDTWGLLTFKQINDISKGVYIDYQDDRIVFTATNEWSTDFAAYFIPIETIQNSKPLGSYVLHYTPATWSNT